MDRLITKQTLQTPTPKHGNVSRDLPSLRVYTENVVFGKSSESQEYIRVNTTNREDYQASLERHTHTAQRLDEENGLIRLAVTRTEWSIGTYLQSSESNGTISLHRCTTDLLHHRRNRHCIWNRFHDDYLLPSSYKRLRCRASSLFHPPGRACTSSPRRFFNFLLPFVRILREKDR